MKQLFIQGDRRNPKLTFKMLADGTGIFYGDGSKIKFDTSFQIINSKTAKLMTFDLSHSTGSEWDPNTVWVYKAKGTNLEFHLSNFIPEGAQTNYLNAKLKNF